MNSQIHELKEMLRRAEAVLVAYGKDERGFNSGFNSDKVILRRWSGDNMEIVRYTDGDFYVKITDPYWPDRVYAAIYRDESLKIYMDNVIEVNKRLEKITVLDDLSHAVS